MSTRRRTQAPPQRVSLPAETINNMRDAVMYHLAEMPPTPDKLALMRRMYSCFSRNTAGLEDPVFLQEALANAISYYRDFHYHDNKYQRFIQCMHRKLKDAVVSWQKRDILQFIQRLENPHAKHRVLVSMYSRWNAEGAADFNGSDIEDDNAFLMLTMRSLLRHPNPLDTDAHYLFYISDLHDALPTMPQAQARARWQALANIVQGPPASYGPTAWDAFCRLVGKKMNETNKTKEPDDLEFAHLKMFAANCGIQNTETMDAASLCAALDRLKTQFLQRDAQNCDLDEKDIFTQELIGDIPEYRRHRLKNTDKSNAYSCFDILELKNDLNRSPGTPLHPLSREPLSSDTIAEIENHYRLVQGLHTKKSQLYDAVTSNQLLTQEQVENDELNNIWSYLPYPPGLTVFLNATNDQLARLWTRLSSNPLFLVNHQENIDFLRAETPRAKIRMLLVLLKKNVPLQDGNTTTRRQAVVDALERTIGVDRDQQGGICKKRSKPRVKRMKHACRRCTRPRK